MDQATEIQSNIQGSFSGNRGDNNVIGNSNVIGGTQTYHRITNFGVINQGGPLGAGDGEPKETSRPYWIVPHSRNSAFTGRNCIIESVKEYCKSQDHHRVALQGLGGCGKTQIALEYIYQRAQESGCHVFWTHGSGMLKFSQDFQTIGQHVQIAQASTMKEVEQFLLSIKVWFEGPDSGDWIVVIDNADNDQDFLINNSPVVKLVPQGNKGTVIFTTRSQLVATRRGCKAIDVNKMVVEEAQELFSKCYRNWDSLEDEEREVVPMILDSLDYLPLAVVGVAAFMTETMTCPSEYWSIFEENDQARTTLLSREFSNIQLETDMTKGILGTYFITFGRITKQMPTAARLLRLIVFFDRQNIPELLLSQSGLEGMDDSIEFRLAIGKSLWFSLVTGITREGKQFYELHRLVQFSIHVYLSPEELDEWKATALGVVSRLFPRDEIEWRYGGIAAAYVPHALAVAKGSPDSIDKSFRFCVGEYLLYIGFYGEVETIFRHALEVNERGLGLDHLKTLRSTNNLASVLDDLGRYGESETMLRRVVEGKEKALGPDNTDTLTSVNNLVRLLQRLGRSGESEPMSRRALEGFEKSLGPDHLHTLRSAKNLASVLYTLER